ncbi:orotidine-5'-phosphate decarboxylase [soil metagenome]
MAACKLIVALDEPDLAAARRIALAVHPHFDMRKIALERFVEAGLASIGLARDLDLPVFLDLKLHDIPETVERAVARASALGATLLTVHAQGGTTMVKRAVERAAKEGGTLKIAAVTVLTSLDDTDVLSIGGARSARDHALALARLAFDAGARAFICAPTEAASLRADLGPEAMLITPGVRPAGSAPGDQKRVATPREAVRAGANAIVVGRAIRDAADPAAAAAAIRIELESVS